MELVNRVDKTTIPGDIVATFEPPTMRGKFVKFVTEDMFIVDVGGLQIGAHKDHWVVLETTKQKPKTRREEELAGFVRNIKTGEYQQMFITQIGSPMLCRNRAVEKAKGYNEYIGEEYDLYDVIVKRRVVEVISYPWENVEVDDEVH